jgi:hypothetical protein
MISARTVEPFTHLYIWQRWHPRQLPTPGTGIYAPHEILPQLLNSLIAHLTMIYPEILQRPIPVDLPQRNDYERIAKIGLPRDMLYFQNFGCSSKQMHRVEDKYVALEIDLNSGVSVASLDPFIDDILVPKVGGRELPSKRKFIAFQCDVSAFLTDV